MAQVAKPSRKVKAFQALSALAYVTKDDAELKQKTQGLDINLNCDLRDSTRHVVTNSRSDKQQKDGIFTARNRNSGEFSTAVCKKSQF